MRTGISITVKPSERKRLKAILNDRNAPQKHAWRAEIILLSAEGLGTNEIIRRTKKSKTLCPDLTARRSLHESRGEANTIG